MKFWFCKSNSCSPCGTTVSGNWKLTHFDENNTLTIPDDPIVFTQNGRDFWGKNDRHHVRGRVEGSWINMTLTVHGEEGEGWVSLAEGSIYEVSDFQTAHMVVSDSFGRHGSISMNNSPFP